MTVKPQNLVYFIGNLGRDPELRYLPSGTPLAKFSIAVNERRPDPNNEGKYITDTIWPDLAAYGKLADRVVKVLKKGAKIAVVAKYSKRPYETQAGEKRTYHEFIVDSFEILKWADDKGDGAGDDGQGEEDEDEFPF